MKRTKIDTEIKLSYSESHQCLKCYVTEDSPNFYCSIDGHKCDGIIYDCCLIHNCVLNPEAEKPAMHCTLML